MRKHGEFYRTILHGPHVTSLYKILLERSFKEQVSWYIEEDHFCINMPDGIREFSMDIQQNYNRVSINGARPADYPSTSGGESSSYN